MAVSRLSIFNRAVSRIKAKAIQSPDEESLEARECRRHYPDIVAELLEGPHDWSFQNRRATLAVNATNDRPSEWAYSYAVPADMGTPIRIVPDLSTLGLGLPVPLPGDPYAETWAAALDGYQADYIIENGTLYTNIEDATLEYGINAVDEVNLTAMVVLAISTELAARIAKPVKDYPEDKVRALSEEAELYRQRAMADDKNRQPAAYSCYIPEGLAARHGYC